MKKVKTGEYNFDSQEWLKVSIEAKELISKMLAFNPSFRYSAHECLQHPWLKKMTQAQEIEFPQLKNVLLNVKNFKSGNKLQEALQYYILKYVIPKEEKAESTKIYQFLNTNQVGKLNQQELTKGYNQITDPVESYGFVESVFQKLDKHELGYINHTDFVLASIDKDRLLSKERIEQTFRAFDKNNKGVLTIKEFQDVFQGLTSEIWEQISREIDTNSIGKISLEEFQKFMII